MSVRRRLLDPKVWVGLGVTALFLWLALRDVPFRDVARIMARANWALLLLLSVPTYLWVVWLRARRWRHLTDAVAPIGTAPLFRAVAVGFMVNNLLPLRVGEVARVWYLARETGASATALFGTVILERVLDTLTVVGLAVVVIALWGAGGEGLLARSALLLLPLALVPAAGLLWLRVAPERVIALATWLLGPFPERLAQLAERLLRRFAEGLGALRSGGHLFWIGVDSLAIWLVGSTLPILAGVWALGIDLGSPLQTLAACWTTLVAVALGVALPSAPGFFGPYHFAARIALERFGVGTEAAVAVGTLVHAVFWVTLTALGLLVLRLRRTSLSELEAAADASGDPPSR